MTGRTYRHFEGQPMYPFGYGLSYSDFKYSDLKVARSSGGMSHVSATVTNISSHDGDEVAELYLSKRDRSNPELKGFERVHLKAGEARTINFELKESEMRDRIVSVGGGQPLRAWTGDRFIQQESR
jgi:beta-glucosidase